MIQTIYDDASVQISSLLHILNGTIKSHCLSVKAWPLSDLHHPSCYIASCQLTCSKSSQARESLMVGEAVHLLYYVYKATMTFNMT